MAKLSVSTNPRSTKSRNKGDNTKKKTYRILPFGRLGTYPTVKFLGNISWKRSSGLAYRMFSHGGPYLGIILIFILADRSRVSLIVKNEIAQSEGSSQENLQTTGFTTVLILIDNKRCQIFEE